MTDQVERKTPQEIVDQTNHLARVFYRSYGCIVPTGYRFDQASHPQEQGMWSLAVMAQQVLCSVNAQDALEDL